MISQAMKFYFINFAKSVFVYIQLLEYSPAMKSVFMKLHAPISSKQVFELKLSFRKAWYIYLV